MKNFKTGICTLLLLLLAFGKSFGQGKDFATLSAYFKSKGYTQGKQEQSDWKGTDDNGDYQARVIRIPISTPQATISVTEITIAQKGTTTAYTLAEDKDNVWIVEDGNVSTLRGRASGRAERCANCFRSFIRNGGVGACASCYNYVRGCSTGGTWYAYAICVGGRLASSTCRPCVTNVNSLINCLRRAW